MPAIRLCTLFSGSSANCAYIEACGKAILIDAGAGVRKTEHALAEISRTYSDLEGIFITHEHTDHIAGLATILKKNRALPVLANELTLDAIASQLSGACYDNFNVLPTGMTARSPAFEITSFRSSHDSVESVGYTVVCGKHKIGYLTDTGIVSDDMFSSLEGSEAVIIESNHDISMLHCGPYPYALKRRIEGKFGHLSNGDCLNTLIKLYASGTRKAILAHLSLENNTPDVAYLTVMSGLRDCGITDMKVSVAPRQGASVMIEL